MSEEINAESVGAYISAYRRIHGKHPKLRDCVEHFDGKLLNVLMSIWELKDQQAEGANQ